MFKDNLARFFVDIERTMQEVIECIDANTSGIALVVDESQRLVATLTDGDIRRAILKGLTLNASAGDLLGMKKDSLYPKPITASLGTDESELIATMAKHRVRHLPIVDEDGRVVDLAIYEMLQPQTDRPSLQAVIMAGGFGTRLQPLTNDIPKPMLPIGGRPILERIVSQLSQSGVDEVNITTHYMPEKIIEHFGDGEDFGVSIKYTSEDKPLGTAGALGLMDKPDEPFLVMNADILTAVDFQSMHDFHLEHQASLTVGVRQYAVHVPYGVVSCNGPHVESLEEKPNYGFLVNAGIYLLEPHVLKYIPENCRFDMTDLINALLTNGLTVVSFPIVEYWLDIGQHADYEQAMADVNKGKIKA